MWPYSVILFLAFAGSQGLDAKTTHCDDIGGTDLSLVQLIATPAKWHGRRVRVAGFLHCKFEDSVLYLSKDDADHLNGKNGLWISYLKGDGLCLQPKNDWRNKKRRDLRYFDRKWVIVEGVFNMEGHGHMAANSGALEETSRVLEARRWYK